MKDENEKTVVLDFLRKEDIDWIRINGDEAIDFEEKVKGIWGKGAELVDGPVIGLFAKQMNSFLTPRVPEEVKIELHQLFDEVIAGDHYGALSELDDVVWEIAVASKVDQKFIPWISAVIEIYKGIIENIKK